MRKNMFENTGGNKRENKGVNKNENIRENKFENIDENIGVNKLENIAESIGKSGLNPKIKVPKKNDEGPCYKRVSFYVEEWHNDKIDEMADKTGMKKNELVRYILDKFFEMAETE